MKFLAFLMGLAVALSADAKTPMAPSNLYNANANQCGMVLNTTPPIFCETFDYPHTNGIRQGQLDSNVWGVSRVQVTNFGQQWYNLWNPTTIDLCDGTTPTVSPPNDIVICNGVLREASNDNPSGEFDGGDVTSLAMYPKQPFDFAGRTGTVSFDVSNNAGPHGAWPEFWLSDAPVPDPFNHFDAWESLPVNGLGIRLDGVGNAGDQGTCPTAANIDKIRWTIESAVVVRNLVMEDTLGYGTPTGLTVTDLDCVIESTDINSLNHVELRISQNQIDVYATDAGVKATPTTLKHIAVVSNAGMTLTRGLVWFEDVHYNGDKVLDDTRPSMRENTFAWDNLAFDGPFTDRDFAFDAPDNNVSVNSGGTANGTVLGQFSNPNETSTWTITGIPANPNPAAVKVLFNFNGGSGTLPTVINIIVNGHAHSMGWPYPDTDTSTTRTYAYTVPATDLVAGTNIVQLGTDTYEAFFNVDLVLGGVPGAVPVLPGSNNTYAAAVANAGSSSSGGGSSSSSSSSSGSSSSSSSSSSGGSTSSSSGSSSGATAVWTNVTPSNASLTGTYSCGNYGTQSVQADTANQGALYANFDCQGIWKSTDYGQTWTGPINTGTDSTIDCGSGFWLTPSATSGGVPTLYTACIRGNSTGFSKSTDGGIDWVTYTIVASGNRQDYFPGVTDPYNANHLLMAGHEFDSVVQSTNGGVTWSAVTLNSGMLTNGGTGDIFFINTGSSGTTANTWLWIAQGSGGTYGTWRTNNAGATWSKVDNNEHVIGYAQIYQPDTSGVLYMAGQYSGLGYGVLRSTDYGQAWTHVGNVVEENSVIGTSKNVYAMDNAPTDPGGTLANNFELAAQPGTGSWTQPSTPSGLTDGAAQFAVVNDGTHNIILGAFYSAGVWRYVEP